MLTQKDLQTIRTVVKDELKHLPTKDEFAEKMDNMMGELKTIREEITLVSGRMSDHTDELDKHDRRLSRTEIALKLPPLTD
ncbi:hypothetical protein A2Z33_01965 [Candidatus Gottesmanbacteria bacterium RBG_16_52_11]|uniref:Uncharacterized protein n=1 Tax=Candidatus Gottesmanbacteria bacterium RBG_16_52_11 TaxID=1798374 RepID=A0A1F5YQS5_9BACT|nr:MAG: hypothetical protein A2Z33_01965 [Candidatus Gottesmanbacteria bacterium RBG_16_52_11]